MSTGITSYLHASVMKGVPFTRKLRGQRSGKSSQHALAAGRRVDTLFKDFALRGVVPTGKSKAAVVCRAAISAIRKRVTKLDDANVFFKVGALKTHADALGWLGSCRVIVELKTTTKSLKDFERAYHQPCSKLERIGPNQNWENTEAMHHQLQLGFTKMAHDHHTKQASVAYVVVAAADGAKVVPLQPQFGTKAMWDRMVAALPPEKCETKATPLVPASVPLWPVGAGCKAVKATTGSAVVAITDNDRVARTACGGAALCAGVPKDELTPKLLARLRRAGRNLNCKPVWVLLAHPDGWRVEPLRARHQTM